VAGLADVFRDGLHDFLGILALDHLGEGGDDGFAVGAVGLRRHQRRQQGAGGRVARSGRCYGGRREDEKRSQHLRCGVAPETAVSFNHRLAGSVRFRVAARAS